MLDDDNGFGKDNPCVHFRQDVSEKVISNLVSMEKISSPTGNIFTGILDTIGGSHYVDFLMGGIGNHDESTPLSEWSIPDHSAEAVQIMWPEIKSELSILNSLYELKDFKNLPKLWSQTSKALTGLTYLGPSARVFRSLRELNRWLRSPSRKGLTLKQLVAATTGQYLNYKFAIAPLVSDVLAIERAIQRTDEAIKRLIEEQDRLHSSHFRKTLKPDDIGALMFTEETAPWNGSKWWWYQLTSEFSGPITYTASMRYNYRVPQMLLEHAQTLGRLDAIGIQFNPAIIWNAIPFSFVVDWFLKVGKTLDGMKTANLAPIVNIEGFSHSVKYEMIDGIYQESYRDLKNDPTLQVSSMKILKRTRVRRIYIRKPFIPSFIIPIDKSGFSGQEISLAASLLGSMWAGGVTPNVSSSSGK
jgi:hypothetical protein